MKEFGHLISKFSVIGISSGQIGHCIGGNFNIQIWAWSADPSVQVRR